ncbi:alpha/beta hydrolase [Qipengyuania sp. JC766]|uniref:alpha/beta hydrolase n=1 Tax=Qipengyuania sp. JC766 TaxID=3232139 RepID=UPI00345B06E7
MRVFVLGVLAIAIVGFGLFLAFTSPPKLLSLLDRAAGGGNGTVKVGTGIGFGDQGQTLDVWAPAEATDDLRPVVIFWYGGGWVKGDRDAYAFAGRALASEGFLVVVPDYRKVPGVRFPSFLQDGADAVRWTRDNARRFGGDPDRISFSGHSAGAYIAVMLALDERWLRAVDVDPEIVDSAVGLSGPYDFYPFDTKRSIDAMHGAPDPLLTQPISFARADAPPLLLITSTEDETVRPRNAINLAAMLEEAGAPVTVINYEGLDHEDVVMALSSPYRGKAPVLQQSAQFMRAAR